MEKELVSLEKQVVHNLGSNIPQPALDPSRKVEIGFVQFTPCPSSDSDDASIEEWLMRANYIEEDLHEVLQFPHDLFWCQVIFDNTFLQSIDSFLRYAPRPHDVCNQPADSVKPKLQVLAQLYFMTCLRMATHKESKEHFITPSVFGDILYENFIYDIPKIMDVCVLFGGNNGALVSKMITNIFTQQPKYNEDLQAIIPTITEVFETISARFGIDETPFSMNLTESAQKLSTGFTSGGQVLTTADLSEMLSYLSDTTATLHAFIDIYPTSAKVFSKNNFMHGLVGFYEELVPVISSRLKSHDWTKEEEHILKPQLQLLLRHSQLCIVKIVRQIIYMCHLKPLLDGVDDNDAAQHVECYLQIITLMISEKRFMSSLDHMYPCSADMDIINQSSYVVDDERIQFLLDGVTEAYSYNMIKKLNKAKRVKKPNVPPSQDIAAAPPTENEEKSDIAISLTYTGVELDSVIASIKDLFPDLGEGFIELALAAFDYKSEALINAMLEGNLPPGLHDLDQMMPRQSSSGADAVKSERPNIYDNDEFDITRRDDVDLSRIHKGKKKDLSQSMLDDKSHLEHSRELYDFYGNYEMVSVNSAEFLRSNAAEYSDEYDDTYDGLIGAGDADSADELTARRPTVTPRVLGQRRQSSDESDDSDAEGAAGNPNRPHGHQGGQGQYRKPDFCQDPAKLREKKAQQWATKTSNKHNSGNARKKLETQEKRFDVVGKAKGQGQSKEVLRNRAYKEKNKNKNRQAMADRKRKV